MNSQALIVGISLLAGTLGSIAAGTAHADSFITSGVTCVPTNPSNFSLLQYGTDGVSTTPASTSTVQVICPTTRKIGASSQLVIAYTFRTGGQAQCTAFGTDSFGTRTGAKNFTLAAGQFDMLLSDVLNPSVDNILTVVCTLPARQAGTLNSLTIN